MFLIEFTEFLEDEVTVGLWKLVDKVLDWPIQSPGFGDAAAEGEAESGGFLAVIEVRRYEFRKGFGFRSVKNLVDVISIRAKHLSEHQVVLIGDHKVHGAGDSRHLLVGIGMEDIDGVYAREIGRSR